MSGPSQAPNTAAPSSVTVRPSSGAQACSTSTASGRKVVSLPPARVTQPGSRQSTCSRFSSEGLPLSSPLLTTGRTPAQVDSTSHASMAAAGNCWAQAASR